MREKLVEILAEVLPYSHGCPEYLVRAKAEMIADSLIANGVTIPVRCKDCKHFIQKEHGCNYFGYYSHTPWVDEVDFCSYGERREGE